MCFDRRDTYFVSISQGNLDCRAFSFVDLHWTSGSANYTFLTHHHHYRHSLIIKQINKLLLLRDFDGLLTGSSHAYTNESIVPGNGLHRILLRIVHVNDKFTSGLDETVFVSQCKLVDYTSFYLKTRRQYIVAIFFFT